MPKTWTPDPAKRGKAKWGQVPGLRSFRDRPTKAEQAAAPVVTESWWMQPMSREAFQEMAHKRHPTGDAPRLMTKGWGS